ncbi:MAG: Wadjet anti-phage system protein JetD domain-containing protein [Dokdonella sp.]
MTWSTHKILKAQVQRLWDRGELLRDLVSGDSRFPLRLILKSPTTNDIAERFDTVRTWVGEMSQASHLRIEWQEVRHRVQGMQRLPATVWVDSLDDALNWIGKHRDSDRFGELLVNTRNKQPALVPWLTRRPLQVLALAEDWSKLLAVIGWLIAHPRPAIHLRQVDLPGIHSKFIESHRGVLSELLDLALPDDAIDPSRTGVSQFATRYGFLEKTSRIRFRSLDSAISLIANTDCPDITLDSDSFNRLQLPIRHVFITENETNFLAFPRVAKSIVIFGSGYGWEALASCRWLNDCAIHYWGDIDTHGFAILDQLRAGFEHVESFLMDRGTLDAHVAFWGNEVKPSTAELSRLTADESALYDDLRNNHTAKNLRLEQEHIGFHWLQKALSRQIND